MLLHAAIRRAGRGEERSLAQDCLRRTTSGGSRRGSCRSAAASAPIHVRAGFRSGSKPGRAWLRCRHSSGYGHDFGSKTGRGRTGIHLLEKALIPRPPEGAQRNESGPEPDLRLRAALGRGLFELCRECGVFPAYVSHDFAATRKNRRLVAAVQNEPRERSRFRNAARG